MHHHKLWSAPCANIFHPIPQNHSPQLHEVQINSRFEEFQNSNSNSNQPLHPTQKIADQSWDSPQSAQKLCRNSPKPWEWLEPNLQKPHAHHQSNISHPIPKNSPHTTRWPWSAVLLTWRRHFKFKIRDALIHLKTHTHAVAATLASFSYSNNMTDQLPNCTKKNTAVQHSELNRSSIDTSKDKTLRRREPSSSSS